MDVTTVPGPARKLDPVEAAVVPKDKANERMEPDVARQPRVQRNMVSRPAGRVKKPRSLHSSDDEDERAHDQLSLMDMLKQDPANFAPQKQTDKPVAKSKSRVRTALQEVAPRITSKLSSMPGFSRKPRQESTSYAGLPNTSKSARSLLDNAASVNNISRYSMHPFNFARLGGGNVSNATRVSNDTLNSVMSEAENPQETNAEKAKSTDLPAISSRASSRVDIAKDPLAASGAAGMPLDKNPSMIRLKFAIANLPTVTDPMLTHNRPLMPHSNVPTGLKFTLQHIDTQLREDVVRRNEGNGFSARRFLPQRRNSVTTSRIAAFLSSGKGGAASTSKDSSTSSTYHSDEKSGSGETGGLWSSETSINHGHAEATAATPRHHVRRQSIAAFFSSAVTIEPSDPDAGQSMVHICGESNDSGAVKSTDGDQTHAQVGTPTPLDGTSGENMSGPALLTPNSALLQPGQSSAEDRSSQQTPRTVSSDTELPLTSGVSAEEYRKPLPSIPSVANKSCSSSINDLDNIRIDQLETAKQAAAATGISDTRTSKTASAFSKLFGRSSVMRQSYSKDFPMSTEVRNSDAANQKKKAVGKQTPSSPGPIRDLNFEKLVFYKSTPDSYGEPADPAGYDEELFHFFDSPQTAADWIFPRNTPRGQSRHAVIRIIYQQLAILVTIAADQGIQSIRDAACIRFNIWDPRLYALYSMSLSRWLHDNTAASDYPAGSINTLAILTKTPQYLQTIEAPVRAYIVQLSADNQHAKRSSSNQAAGSSRQKARSPEPVRPANTITESAPVSTLGSLPPTVAAGQKKKMPHSDDSSGTSTSGMHSQKPSVSLLPPPPNATGQTLPGTAPPTTAPTEPGPGDTSDQSTMSLKQERASLESKLQRNHAYLGVALFNSEGRLLLQMNGLLPMVTISSGQGVYDEFEYSQVAHLTILRTAMDWEEEEPFGFVEPGTTEQGEMITVADKSWYRFDNLSCRLAAERKINDDCPRRVRQLEFLAAADNLRRILNLKKLGYVRDVPIRLPALNSRIYLAVQFVPDDAVLHIAREALRLGVVRWRKQESLNASAYVSDNFNFSFDIAKLYEEKNALVSPGLYLGLFHVDVSLNGLHLVVPSTHRHMLPLVKIHDNIGISEEDEQFLLSLQLAGQNNFNPDPKTLTPFEQAFLRGFDRLQVNCGTTLSYRDLFLDRTVELPAVRNAANLSVLARMKKQRKSVDILDAMSENRKFVMPQSSKRLMQTRELPPRIGGLDIRHHRPDLARIIIIAKPMRQPATPRLSFDASLSLTAFQIFETLHSNMYSKGIYSSFRRASNTVSEMHIEVRGDLARHLSSVSNIVPRQLTASDPSLEANFLQWAAATIPNPEVDFARKLNATGVLFGSMILAYQSLWLKYSWTRQLVLWERKRSMKPVLNLTDGSSSMSTITSNMPQENASQDSAPSAAATQPAYDFSLNQSIQTDYEQSMQLPPTTTIVGIEELIASPTQQKLTTTSLRSTVTPMNLFDAVTETSMKQKLHKANNIEVGRRTHIALLRCATI